MEMGAGCMDGGEERDDEEGGDREVAVLAVAELDEAMVRLVVGLLGAVRRWMGAWRGAQ